MALQTTGFVMILPLFARRFESFGAGVQALGASAMAFALTSLISAPFMGMLADRFGRRPIILLSLSAYTLAFCGYLVANTVWLLILLRGLAGVFTAGLVPAMTSMVGDLAPEDRRGRWIGIVNGGASAGWVVGPLLGGLLYDRFGYSVSITASVAMAAGALLLAAFRIPETSSPTASHRRRRSSWTLGWRSLPARSTFLMLMLVTFGVMFAWAFTEPQFMFYTYDDLNWSSSQLGFVMSTYGMAFMSGAFVLGQLSDRRGRKPALVLGMALFSAQFIGLVFFHQAAWIVLSFMVAGLGNALFDPALGATILDISPREHTAGLVGVKSTAGSLGSLLGPALVVLVAPVAGPQIVFLVSASLVCMLALVTGFFLRIPRASEFEPGVAFG
jgi:MFS family permease